MKEIPNFDPKKLEIVKVDGSFGHDMTDSYIVEAEYNGEELTEQQLDWLNESSHQYDLLISYFT
jgi:isopentenyl phosphate kinase